MNAEAEKWIAAHIHNYETVEGLVRAAITWAYLDAVGICQEIDEGAGYGTGAYDAKVAIARRLA